ncbi:unnamed protein product, partial [Porites evermanni]
ITANDRARNYPEGTFHADDGRLFCSLCNVVVDHLRKFVVDKHLEAASHKRNAERKDSGKQQTLKTVMNCKIVAQLEKVHISHEWIKVCTAANIPLHKSDNPLMREFLQSRVVNGGAIPKYHQKQKVALIVDELSDDEGRYVVDFTAVLLNFDELSPNGNSVAYLLDTHFLNATNNRTV